MRNNDPLPAASDETVDNGRRSLFAIAAAAPLVLIALGSRATAQPAPACLNDAALPTAQKSMRRSLNFKNPAPDPNNKNCGLCTFFKTPDGPCGKCDLLSGGPVPATGVCDSWAKKA